MYLSLNWLCDHVDLAGLDASTIAQELTMRTALIEGLVDQRAALDGVVVGEVLACGPHPGADRLSLCEVAWGQPEPARVVCGAPNVAVGQKIIYAPVGTRLPNGLKLKQAKIRGEASAGMICAEDELGLGPEHDGILVLPQPLEPGQPVGQLPGLADVVFDIDNNSVTHRPDLWGHRGFARELAAIFGRELLPLDLDGSLTPGASAPALELDAGGGCPLYAGLCLEDEAAVRSPDWLRFRLVACGMRPIQLLVDLSNYVMLELGQPTHPFDRDQLAEDRIVVRRGREGEVLRTLDDVDRTLSGRDVVIADGQRAVALAGIMGSAAAEVGEATRRVLLESATFDPRDVRATSSRLGLRTEALARFEKSLDPALVEQALRRYAALVKQLRPGARIDASYALAGEASAPQVVIPLSSDLVRARLGCVVEDAEIERVLQTLGCQVDATGPGVYSVTVPSWRATRDLSLPEDLVEEVGRIVGYDRVPSDAPRGRLLLGGRDGLLQLEETLRDGLAERACFTESYAYSTVRDRTLELMGLPLEAGAPRLTNALQQDASRLRPSVVPAMLERLEDWLRHTPEVRVFEVGRGYALREGGMHETREVAAVLARRGAVEARDLVRELKGVAELALASVDREAAGFERWTPDAGQPWFHPTRSATLSVGDVRVGCLGAVDPALLARLDLDASAGLLVLDVAALATSGRSPTRYERVPRLPAAQLDLAFVLDYDLSTATLVETIQRAGPRSLKRVQPFDVYRGAPLSSSERSIAFHLTFLSDDRTLTDAEVNKARDRIVAAAEKLGARLRAR